MKHIAILVALLPVSLSYRILAIFPTPSFSHQIVFRPVMDKLAENGHHVVVMTPHPSGNPNLTEIDLSNLKEIWALNDFTQTSELSPLEVINLFVEILKKIIVNILTHPEVQALMAEKPHFDAVICEFLGYTPLHAFARFFGAPLIGMSSLDMMPGDHAAIGNFDHLTIHPAAVFHFHGKLGFWERLQAVLLSRVLYHLVAPKLEANYRAIIQEYFGPIGTPRDLLYDITFAIVSAHPALDNVRPVVPSTIQVGFLHIKPPRPLLSEYLEVLDRPTIYMSLGSNVQSATLKPHILETILKVFKRLKQYNVVWKWESERTFDDIPNLHLFKWIPQQDLLAHQNVQLFITQGGQQSMEEAIDRGVPLLVVPFFADQMVNAKKVPHLGIGENLFLEDFGEESFFSKISQVLNDERYRENVLKLQKIVRDAPMPPVETAVWWIEYAIRHNGAPHLKYRGIGVPFWEFFHLDIILFIVLVLLAVATAGVVVLKTFLKVWRRKFPGKLKSQ